MALFTKIKWVLGITVVFLLILMTNLIDRQNFVVVRDSIETIYADRLVAQDIIFDLYKLVLEKETFYSIPRSTPAQDEGEGIDARIAQAIAFFETTKLTQGEAVVFDQFRQSLRQLQRYEAAYRNDQANGDKLAPQLETIKEQLDDLAAIQVQEGKEQLHRSKKAISSVELFTQLEVGALIVLAIAIQLVLLYTPGMEVYRQESR